MAEARVGLCNRGNRLQIFVVLLLDDPEHMRVRAGLAVHHFCAELCASCTLVENTHAELTL